MNARGVIVATGCLILGAVGWSIVQKERLLREGTRVRLELATRDPRSLMQGDYMVLRYALARDFGARPDGVVELDLGEGDVASLATGTGDVRIVHRLRGGEHRLGTDGFYFEEGTGGDYAAARYAELRVDTAGNSVLVGLLDEKFVRLGPE